MKLTKQLISKIVLAIVAVALVASFAVVNFGQPVVKAADSTTTPAPGTTPAPKTSKADQSQLAQEFKKNFAGQLGVDEARLDSAYTNAVNATVDQAVKDGKLTQAQADKIKENAKSGYTGGFFGKDIKGNRGAHPGKDGRSGAYGYSLGEKGAFEAAAKALNLTTAELQTQLKAGKSIADVATDKKVDIKTVKDAVLASIKADLGTRVKDGKLTQAQADTRYQAAVDQVEKLVNARFTGQGKFGKR